MSEKGKRYLKALGRGAKLKVLVAQPEPAPRSPDSSILGSGDSFFTFSDNSMASQPSRPPLVASSVEVDVASRDRAHPPPNATSEVVISGSRDWDNPSVSTPPGAATVGGANSGETHSTPNPTPRVGLGVADRVASSPISGTSLAGEGNRNMNALTSSFPHVESSGFNMAPANMAPVVTSWESRPGIMASHSGMYAPIHQSMASHAGWHGHPQQFYVGLPPYAQPVRHFVPTMPATTLHSALAQPFRQDGVVAPTGHTVPFRQDEVVAPAANTMHASMGVFPPLNNEEGRNLRPSPPDSVVGISVDSDVKTHSPFSFSDAIARLGNVLPEYVSEARGNTSAGMSASELALGRRATSSGGLCLLESPMMGKALGDQMTKVRGGSEPPLPGTVPSLPSALQCGSFLKAEKLPFDAKRFSCSSIPAAPAVLSQEDILLLGESGRSSARSVSLKEKCVLELEENSRRGLMAISAMDSFLAGLIKTVKEDVDDIGDETPSFSLREEIDEDDLYSFLTAVSSCVSYTANSLASMHTNLVLARRDAILEDSHALKKSSVTKNSLRAIPLSPDSLFGGGHVSSTLHSLAETKRDLVLTNPRPAPKGAGTSYPSKGGFKHPSQTSQNRGKKKVFSKSKKNTGKPYERPQTPKSGAKPSPQ